MAVTVDVRSQSAQNVLRRVQGKTKEMLFAAACEHANQYKTFVSINYPPASTPGEYPRKRTGRGFRSIYCELDDTGDIRTTKAYAVIAGTGIHLHFLNVAQARLGIEDAFFDAYQSILQAARDAA